jgi:hypothetical protein
VAQFARPASDILTTGWLTNSGSSSSLFATLDEVDADETDFATQTNGGNNNAFEVGLGSVDAALIDRLHIVSYRYRKHQALGNVRNLQVQLRQGTTVIATGTLHTDISVVWIPGAFLLTPAQGATITDYTNLRLRFIPTGTTSGSAARRQVQIAWAQLRVPDTADLLDDWRTRWGVPAEITTLETLLLWLAPQAEGDLPDPIWVRRYNLAYAVWKLSAYRPMLAEINAGTYPLPTHQTQAFAATKIEGKLTRFQAIADTLDAEDAV